MCVCSAPPSLSCTQKKCPLIAVASRERVDCAEVRDEQGCCLLSYSCPTPPPALPGKESSLPPVQVESPAPRRSRYTVE
ncbi:MAG: hypothetical protein ACK56F_20705, partial [bacterium]